MEFQEPSDKNFTIYSKSGCHYCNLAKRSIKHNNLIYNEINCDDYIFEEKENFLSFIESKSGKPCKTFPIIFYNGKFIGGYNETIEFMNNLLLSFEDDF
jgi:glutaredoxin